MTADRTYDPADISSRDFWSRSPRERDRTFAELRAQRPVSWHRPTEGGWSVAETGPEQSGGTTGFWAATRFADVQTASRDVATFTSAEGITMEEMPKELLELSSSFLVMDPPRHTWFRKIVSGLFTRRRIAALEAAIDKEATRLVDRAVERGELELVAELSSRLPLWTISEMMGVPEELRGDLMHFANVVVGTDDPELVPPGPDAGATLMNASMWLHGLAQRLAAERRGGDGEDILSLLANAEVDGQRLTDVEIGAIFQLFAIAGNDTTRNSISHGVMAFAENPDQWQRYRTDAAELDTKPAEEIIRWATPVIQFRRTATCDTTLAGQAISKGDLVVLFYASANRDESAFTDPWRFDIGREPRHLSFGGGGPHFCLGAHLARTQVDTVFRRLSTKVDRFEVNEVTPMPSHFINGLKRVQVALHS